MAYLGTDDLRALLPGCIDKYDPDRIANAAYELCLGNEAYVSDSKDGKKEKLPDDDSMVIIKPGQFALLLTEEVLTIPNHILAFISIKFSQKIKGLINVSGFHVDPGFEGKLIFSVYNAGPATIILERGTPYFMIWFSQLSKASDEYKGKHKNQDSISAENISAIKGDLASPNVLQDRIEQVNKDADKRIIALEKDQKAHNYLYVTGIGLFIAILLKIIFDYFSYNKGVERGLELKKQEVAMDSTINQKLIEKKRLIQEVTKLEQEKAQLKK